MRQFNNYLFGKNFRLLFSQEILDNSYPNTDYQSIANTTFETIIFSMKSKTPQTIEQILEKSKNKEIIFVNAHGGKNENEWVIYPNSYEQFIPVQEFYNQLRYKNPNSYLLFYFCNPLGKIIKGKDITYPLSNVYSVDVEKNKFIHQ